MLIGNLSLLTGLIVALVGGVAGGVVLVVLVAIVVAACFCVGLNYQTTKGKSSSGWGPSQVMP